MLGSFSANPIISTTAQNMSIAMLATRWEYHSFSCHGIFLNTWRKIGIARNVHKALPSTIRPNTNILNHVFISSSFRCRIMTTAPATIWYAIHHQVAVTQLAFCQYIFSTDHHCTIESHQHGISRHLGSYTYSGKSRRPHLDNHLGRAISFPCYPTPPNPPKESFGAIQHNHQTGSTGKKAYQTPSPPAM